eukprot:462701_1
MRIRICKPDEWVDYAIGDETFKLCPCFSVTTKPAVKHEKSSSIYSFNTVCHHQKRNDEAKEKEGLIKRVRDKTRNDIALELWRLMMQKRITISNKEETIAWISILCFYMLISGVCGGDRLLQMLLFWMENLKCLVFIMSESHTTYGRERWVSNKE